MQVNEQLIDRLVQLSRTSSYNHYERFDWPEHLECVEMWCDEDLLTTHGTDVHDRLTGQQRMTLSKWEAINFFSLNVHGIKEALEFIARSIYNKRYRDVSEYMHVFLAEENAHMWFFAKFCMKYAGKLYPHMGVRTQPAADPLERDFYMFASTLIFEEYVDFYNHKVGVNKLVPAILREINQQHHIDESRHVSFGRELVKELFNELAAKDHDGTVRVRVNQTIKGIFMYFVGLMYNPLAYADSGILSSSGFETGAALRNYLRYSPSRKEYHNLWFKRTAKFFAKCGIVEDSSFLTA